MKDIPVFTTENGAASLILREIPYRKRAHIRLQATREPEALLEEWQKVLAHQATSFTSSYWTIP